MELKIRHNINWEILAPAIRSAAAQGRSNRQIAEDLNLKYTTFSRLLESPNDRRPIPNNSSAGARAARAAYHQGRAEYHTTLAIKSIRE